MTSASYVETNSKIKDTCCQLFWIRMRVMQTLIDVSYDYDINRERSWIKCIHRPYIWPCLLQESRSLGMYIMRTQS